ncbi:TPA: Abi family protein [Vibrio vulnificus]|nr:Abi family protein [Vibrio vulnificus]ELX4138792.1 Abi family protein [Vibrio vulnificus]HBC3369794.1 Abi family protein [Vibrio vulnificus]HDY7428557.1 Abi family protein [Vibrio vulnificus]HDY7552991.1 Abi family protein [Vibrio vulnificus]
MNDTGKHQSMPYDKPWHSCEEMIIKLRERGLTITDEAKAISYLSRIGYYRLSGYLYSFRQLKEVEGKKVKIDEFVADSTFEQAVQLYVFDKKLRLLVMDALERIEIAFRVEVSHLLGEKDKFAYLNPTLFHEKFSVILNPKTGVTDHHNWISKHAALINRSKEKFIDHNKKKHGLPLPIWIACEVWDFGTLSFLYSGMKEADQDLIAAKFGLNNGRVLASWLRALNYLRNLCAHHSRLWNCNVVEKPKLPSAVELPWVEPFITNDWLRVRPFLLLCITKHLLDSINPTSTWWSRLSNLMLTELPDMKAQGLDLKSMGVTENWAHTFAPLEEKMEVIKNP